MPSVSWYPSHLYGTMAPCHLSSRTMRTCFLGQAFTPANVSSYTPWTMISNSTLSVPIQKNFLTKKIQKKTRLLQLVYFSCASPHVFRRLISSLAAYNQKASIESVLSIYGEFEPRTIRLLKLADPEGFRIWKLTDMDETPHWSSNHTTLLGDACHPVLPFGFSGASMGIEDALTLSTLLPSGVETKDIPNRLQLYENIRRPRVATVRDTSRDIARGLDDRQRLREYFQFLTSHDAVKHAQETLEKHLKSSE